MELLIFLAFAAGVDKARNTCSGGIYGENEYDAGEMIWNYMPFGPFRSAAEFSKAALDESSGDCRHFVVVRERGPPLHSNRMISSNSHVTVLLLGMKSPRKTKRQVKPSAW